MKKISVFIVLSFVLQACVRHQETTNQTEVAEISDTVYVKYAEGFEVNYQPTGIEIISHSISNNSPFADTLILPTIKLVDQSVSDNMLNPDIKSLACQSSTHLAFLNVLGKLNLVKGLCGLEYVQNLKIIEALKKNETIEICAGEQAVIEPLQQISPDLFLIYPFETEGKQKYNAAGIRTFYIAEYLEQSPLARLEWIKLFGLITGETKLANAYFEKTEKEYLSLATNKKDTSSRFILNLPFKENWFMPSANSMIVNLIEDAGLTYYYPASGITENENRSTETVWNDGVFAEYWIIMASRPADFSLEDLLAEEPVYKEFSAVKNNRVIFCNTSTSDYFVEGVVEPEIILKDILFATGNLSDHNPKYFSLLK